MMERLGTSKASDRSPAIALSRILEELLKWAKPVKLRQWSYNKYSFARTIMMLQMLANSTCCLFHRNPSKPPSPFQVSNGISTSVGGKGSIFVGAVPVGTTGFNRTLSKSSWLRRRPTQNLYIGLYLANLTPRGVKLSILGKEQLKNVCRSI